MKDRNILSGTWILCQKESEWALAEIDSQRKSGTWQGPGWYYIIEYQTGDGYDHWHMHDILSAEDVIVEAQRKLSAMTRLALEAAKKVDETA